MSIVSVSNPWCAECGEGRGSCAVLPVQSRYEWLYFYAFVRLSTGQTWWLLLPTASTEAMALALQEFARDVGIEGERRCVLVLDRAGWHMSEQVGVPERIRLEALPAYSPELQPAERLWTVTDEGIANRHSAIMEELQERQSEHYLEVSTQRERVRAQTRFHG